jgi:hypothetical protein
MEAMLQARETCEGVAYRGHRMLEQVTQEFKSFKVQAQQQHQGLEEQVEVFAKLAKVGCWGGRVGGGLPSDLCVCWNGWIPGRACPAMMRVVTCLHACSMWQALCALFRAPRL